MMQFDRFWLHTKCITHPFCILSIFHSYSIALGQQQLLKWADSWSFPLSLMNTAQHVFPHHLKGHCVLNPGGTIIPDRGLLSLGHRGRGNFRAESMLTDDPQSRESCKIQGHVGQLLLLLVVITLQCTSKKWRSPSNQLPEWVRQVQYLPTVFTFHCCDCTD